MSTCTACGKSVFQNGRCASCGTPMVVRGSPVAAPPMQLGAEHLVEDPTPVDPASIVPSEEPLLLDPSALIPEVPLIEGFEGTMIAAGAGTRISELAPIDGFEATQLAVPEETPGEVSFATCPRCRTQQPDPPPPICDACGMRLFRRPKAAPAPKAAFKYTRCPQCEAPVPDPPPAFCEGCGVKLRRLGKGNAPRATGARALEEQKRCGDCGCYSEASASSCGNCGARLPSA